MKQQPFQHIIYLNAINAYFQIQIINLIIYKTNEQLKSIFDLTVVSIFGGIIHLWIQC